MPQPSGTSDGDVFDAPTVTVTAGQTLENPSRTTAPSGRTAMATTVATTPTATTPTCTDDSSQWADSDGDGYGDNPSGTNGDRFPNDALNGRTPTVTAGDNFVDEDGDGVSESETSAQRSQAVQGPAEPRLPGQRR